MAAEGGYNNEQKVFHTPHLISSHLISSFGMATHECQHSWSASLPFSLTALALLFYSAEKGTRKL
jgi:hypothetical protein